MSLLCSIPSSLGNPYPSNRYNLKPPIRPLHNMVITLWLHLPLLSLSLASWFPKTKMFLWASALTCFSPGCTHNWFSHLLLISACMLPSQWHLPCPLSLYLEQWPGLCPLTPLLCTPNPLPIPLPSLSSFPSPHFCSIFFYRMYYLLSGYTI